MTILTVSLLKKTEPEGLMADLARLVESSPWLAGLIMAVLVLLVLVFLRRVLSVAVGAMLILAVAAAGLVVAVGPEKARSYLGEVEAAGPELMDSIERAKQVHDALNGQAEHRAPNSPSGADQGPGVAGSGPSQGLEAE